MKKTLESGWPLVVLALVGGAISSHAQSESSDQLCALKSMFVYNFIKHIQWPDDPTAKVVQIGLIGDDDALTDAFERMAKAKSTATQQIVVKRVSSHEGLEYQILYLAADRNSEFTEVIMKIKDKPVVLVAEDDRFLGQGAFIAFKKVDAKLRFQINKNAFDRGGFKVSSTLISMAL